MKINIIYEDNHIIVAEKPVNIPTQEDESGDMDMLSIIKQDLKERYNKPGNVFLGLVHRLDRPVGGVMVFAKTSKSASRISEEIRKREFKKTYIAIIHGIPNIKSDKLEHYLVKNSKENKVYVTNKDNEDAKLAILEYEIAESKGNLSLAKIDLHTGRPHQIRVQFATIGHPLYGDQKYNKKVAQGERQIALWSNQLIMSHPITKEKMTFQCNPPDVYPWNAFKI